MIHKNLCIQYTLNEICEQKKRDFFFLSDLCQDHLINDFVEKLIEIKRMTTQVN